MGGFTFQCKTSGGRVDKQDMVGFDAALENIQRIEARVDLTAHRVAEVSLGTDAPGDVISLSDEAVSLLKARTDLGATTALIRTLAEMQDHILDVLG